LQTVFLSLFTGNKTFDITVDSPVLDSDLSTLSLKSGEGSLSNPIIASWLSRNSISLQANSISAKLSFSDFIGSLNNANVALKAGPNLTFDSLVAKIPGATLTRGQEYLKATDIDLTLAKDLKLQVLAKEITSNIQNSGLSFSKLIIQSSLPSFNLAKQKFDIEVSLGSLSLNTSDVNLAIPNLSGKIVINDMAFSQVEASFDSLAIDYQDYAMSVPTSSINARMQDTTFLLGFATKDQEITHMEKTGSNAIEANSLKGSAEFQKNGQQYMQFSLQGLQTNQFGVAVILDGINISAQATKTSKGYKNLDLSLDSTATLDWETEAISLASPLSLSLHLSDYFTKQSASLDLDPASTNLFTGPFLLVLSVSK
ncbi:hypothetical protein, partial [uncultured Sphaerochaeta sp.]|uniref:hypothetical protein n=1 Tax=uncultured Sphaerochaeta sp. TaxID=886478 RepID=UPI002A0A16EA